MRRYKLNRKVQIYLLSIFIVVFTGLIVKDYFSFKIKNVELLENSNVSYKVYLKNSTFFDGNDKKQYNFNMIDKIKKELLELKNKKVDLKVNNLRNKSEIVTGKIIEYYDRLFILETESDLLRSFNYSDILIGNVEICKKY